MSRRGLSGESGGLIRDTGNPAFLDVLDEGTAFLHATWRAEQRAGTTNLGWMAWARAAGVIVNTKPEPAWDDIRCSCRGKKADDPGHRCAAKGALPLSSVLAVEGASGSVASLTYEPIMRLPVSLAPGEQRRRPLRKRHRRRPPKSPQESP